MNLFIFRFLTSYCNYSLVYCTFTFNWILAFIYYFTNFLVKLFWIYFTISSQLSTFFFTWIIVWSQYFWIEIHIWGWMKFEWSWAAIVSASVVHELFLLASKSVKVEFCSLEIKHFRWFHIGKFSFKIRASWKILLFYREQISLRNF